MNVISLSTQVGCFPYYFFLLMVFEASGFIYLFIYLFTF